MKVALFMLGTRGDAQPAVALGKGLKADGHEVRVVTHARFEELVRSHGLQFSGVRTDPQEVLWDARDTLRPGERRGTIGILRAIIRHFEDVAREAWPACQDADAIIYSTLAMFIAQAIAEQRGIPTVLASMQPVVRSRLLPASGWPDLPARFNRVAPGYNALTYHVIQQIPWQLVRRPTNRWRRELGLPPVGIRGPFRDMRRSRHPVLLAYSDTVVPRPADYPPWVHSTGFWFLERLDLWQPPGILVDFLRAGPAPVFFSLGSLSVPGASSPVDLAVASLRLAGRRGIIVDINHGAEPSLAGDDVLVARDVPYDWLLPQVAAAACATGAGTTAAVLRAGLASVPLPVEFDQIFWADQLHRMGVAVRRLNLRKLTPDDLARSVEQVLGDAAMRQRAADMGARLRDENGVARAVGAFNAEMSAATAPAQPLRSFGSSPSL